MASGETPSDRLLREWAELYGPPRDALEAVTRAVFARAYAAELLERQRGHP